jgi:hypothetical protein
MKKIVFSISIFFVLAGVTINTSAQNKKVAAVITADSLASGNYKDVLTSFFQIGFDKLTGKEKELKFSSNPYAVMMKANPDLEIDYNYKKNRVLRNLNFNFNIKLDTSYRFNGFSSGISYAIINKRDYTVYHEFIRLAIDKNADFNQLQDGLTQALGGIAETGLKNRLREQGHKLLTDETFTYDKLDSDVRQLILQVIKDSSLTRIEKLIKDNNKANVAKSIKDGYNAVKKSFQSKPLLTFSISDTTYKDQFMFSNLVLKLEYLQGFSDSKPGANWEFNIPATFNFLNDTLRAGRDLKRSVFRIEPGINLVIRNSDAEHSFFEMKFSGEYNRIFNGLYAGEEKNRFTFNGTLRIRVINDIWVPLQFKYDPKKGNVFGFLSVKLNFSGQGKEKK